MIRMLALAALGLAMTTNAAAHDPETGRATAIVNEGVMVEAGGAKVLFDPVFEEGIYDHMDHALAARIIGGEAPYDGVDAVFISHAHRDHFHPGQLIAMLAAQPDLRLYAPSAAVDTMRAHEDWRDAFSDRVHSVRLTGDEHRRYTQGAIVIDAVRVPHAGFPERHADLENLVFRVALTPGQRVMHLGDADGKLEQFAPHADLFANARTGIAFVPFWMLLEEEGQTVIDETLNSEQAIGIHLGPEGYEGLAAEDIFTRPGQVRPLPHTGSR